MRMQTLESMGINAETINQYDQRIPRYTSYPTAPFWTEEFDASRWSDHLRQNAGNEDPVSLYVHIPFCGKHCLFCACNVIITPRRDVAEDYLGYLEKEISLVSEQADVKGPVVQLHFGGGTPNYLDLDQMERVVRALEASYPFAKDAERSIEIDPRVANPEYIAGLHHRLGFNRISFGTQDFNEDTQSAIGRGQTREVTFENVTAARKNGYGSVNIDLIYGLPRQDEDTWRETLDTVAELRPDRIALYNFAFLPSKLAHQRALSEEVLPAPSLKLQMFIEAHNRLTHEGYVFIGMDHYALATDSLAKALEDGSLRRNFMGYNTLRGTGMLSFGTSAISDYRGAFAQNDKKLSVYKRMITEGHIPVERGLPLSPEDLERRHLIEELMCGGVIRLDALSSRAREIIREERGELTSLEEGGLLTVSDDEIRVTGKGRVFLRNIAVIFDEWIRKARTKHLFSRAV
ncbi:MAG: oxygen-independent coproporphyrinogen III oxidase [Candidatus Sumerlaeia bacterium]|nr:oxygen-independent coproporphyrinogen III oxidase [Candidatus Sumerlaeia bacterium]